MNDIGIKGLVNKSVDEIDDLVKLFIKSSLNIRDGIAHGDNPEICMLSLIRDTYMCTLLLRYVGLMTIVDSNPKWGSVDNKLIEYIQDYYSNEKFKNKLIELYEHYLTIYEKTQANYDYCKFLDKMIRSGDVPKDGVATKKLIRMIENKIFNVMSVNPIVKIPQTKFRQTPSQFEIKGENVLVHLTYTNYLEILDNVNDHQTLHDAELSYMARTDSILTSFSKLIVARQTLANQTGDETYFKYVNHGKNDISDTLKYFLTELNAKLDAKIRNEVVKIYQNANINRRNKNTKIKRCDIIKYTRSKRNTTRFDQQHVFHVLFKLLENYFNIKVEKTTEKGWSSNVVTYNLIDCSTSGNNVLGRLFLDIFFDENKRVSDPISIRLSDKMMINQSGHTVAEIALLANYQHNKGLTYNDVVLLFKEFGYVVNNVCYESRVGLINYDDEFSNYIPSLMECIAWDRDTISMIAGSRDRSIVDHIEISREADMCYNIKLKSVNAKFDHLLHNSEPLIKIITNAVRTRGDANREILETYRDIYKEVMDPISTMLDTDINHIDPHAIIQEINGSQGVLYSNLMNEIFAYASFWIIKNQSDPKDRSIVNTFRRTVLNNGVINYRELIRNFLKHADVNCFTLYVKNVIKVDVFDDYLTEDTNYFDEDGDPNESDVEEIIQINRV